MQGVNCHAIFQKWKKLSNVWEFWVMNFHHFFLRCPSNSVVGPIFCFTRITVMDSIWKGTFFCSGENVVCRGRDKVLSMASPDYSLAESSNAKCSINSFLICPNCIVCKIIALSLTCCFYGFALLYTISSNCISNKSDEKYWCSIFLMSYLSLPHFLYFKSSFMIYLRIFVTAFE